MTTTHQTHTTQGLIAADWREFDDLLIMANDEQISHMRQRLLREIIKRQSVGDCWEV